VLTNVAGLIAARAGTALLAQIETTPTTEPSAVEQWLDENSMLFGGIVTLVAMAVGLLFLYGATVRNRRARAMAPTAEAHGLRYSAGDLYGSTQVAFPLFRAGDGRIVENVMSREGANGLEVRVFDYAYYDEHRDENGRLHKRWDLFNCAMARHNGVWPVVHISKERVLDKVAQSLGLPDIELESEEFNRLFRVQCADARFATALVDPRMMEFLLTTEGKLSFETKGRWLLVIAPRLDTPKEMVGLLGVADEFLRRIPNVVWELYPEGADTDRGVATTATTFDGALMQPIGSVHDVLREEMAASGTDWRDPTPGVDYDLDGNPVEDQPRENPWG
jgi:hypothetical protein